MISFTVRFQLVGALAALTLAGCSASAGSADAPTVIADADILPGDSVLAQPDAAIDAESILPIDATASVVDAPVQDDSTVAAPDAAVATADAVLASPDAFVAPPDAHVATPDAHVATPDAFVPSPDAAVQTCSSIVLETPLPTATSPVGTQVTLSATATCDPGGPPLFQWWLQLQGQTPTAHFFNLGNYAQASTVMWDTTGVAPGTYNIQAYLGVSNGTTVTFQRGSTLKSKVLN